MKLTFDINCIDNLHSNSQIIRVLSENWFKGNMYCPRCGCSHVESFKNNQPVADFFCPECSNEYELKSKNGNLGKKINDGAYETMIERISSNQNPDFFLLSYSKKELIVKDLIFIPKYLFTPNIIEKRKPLSQAAQRAGWTGCNILIDQIPKQGMIQIIKNSNILDKRRVIDKANTISKLETKDINYRSWLMDTLNCVNAVPNLIFSLDEIYKFENLLKDRHSHNKHIKAKIRQQLQLLRDKGFIKFLGNGKYKKLIL